ncbi:hypothetical protein DY000_02052421 [Brassica cretica]|uniref:Uncharacterized protein n=1 Tax=Brassica cretica TaxID=69181 RepID=A0ABQ7A9E0_BRACR|nr:hypothetical protein DY000_02052421 [Brassica cretica]
MRHCSVREETDSLKRRFISCTNNIVGYGLDPPKRPTRQLSRHMITMKKVGSSTCKPGVEGSPGVPSIHPLDLTNKLHRKQPGTTTDQIVQPSVCLSFLSGSLSEFSIFSVMIFSTRDQKNEEEFGHNLPPNCLDEQLPKRPRLRFLMIHPDHLLH